VRGKKKNPQAKLDLREIVIKAEEENKRNLEMLQQAKNMENEASELKRKALKGN
jgi:hypothetical protein